MLSKILPLQDEQQRKKCNRKKERIMKERVNMLMSRQWHLQYDIDGKHDDLCMDFVGTNLVKLKRGNRMLFLMKIVKFSTSFMGALWERQNAECYSLPQSDAQALDHSDVAPFNWPTEMSKRQTQREGHGSRAGTELTFGPHHFQQDTSLWFRRICFSHWLAHTCQSTLLAEQKHTLILVFFFHFLSLKTLMSNLIFCYPRKQNLHYLTLDTDSLT